MEYSIEVRRNKSVAKCRICKRVIPAGMLCVFVYGTDGFNIARFVGHTDCFLSFIITAVKKEELRVLNEEHQKFTQIEKLLKGRRT